jgi:hypothetical protein
MIKFYYCILISTFSIVSFGQKNLAGIFATNFPTYGRFDKTLTLNCDSTLILNFRGELMDDNSKGRWIEKDKKLILIFDSISYPSQRYKAPIVLKVKRNKLYQVNLTIEEYRELKIIVEKLATDNGQKLKILSYSALRKNFSKTMKNFKGKTGKQYFKKVKTFNCDNIKSR